MKLAAKIVLVNVAVTLAIVLALEFGSRLLWPVELPDPLITKDKPGWADSRVYDPILFWRMQPNVVVGGVKRTNSVGLRGDEILPKRANEFRILSLGESTTFAARLPNDKNYSSLLARLLPRIDGKQVSVVNAGVSGYSLFQGVTFLEWRGLALEPDAVLTYFGFNDFLPVSYREERDEQAGASAPRTDRELFEHQRGLRFRIGYALLSSSNLARLVSLHGAQMPARASDLVRVPEADRRALLDQLAAFCAAKHLRLAVAIPWYRDFDKHIPLLREWKAPGGVVIIDLPALLEARAVPRGDYFIDAVHPNARGHQLIAEAIEAKLAES
jgi:lysophospholipase L1-like esterase